MASKVTKGEATGRPRSKATKTKPKNGGAKSRGERRQRNERLRPGQLDRLVLSYMKKHKAELPLTATRVAHGIKRSSGAVGNCLGRLEEAEKVRLAEQKPR